MEKCNLCVQRIQLGKNQALLQRRAMADGDVATACQQACPTGAIVFGDLADPESRVSKLLAGRRALPRPRRAGDAPDVGHRAALQQRLDLGLLDALDAVGALLHHAAACGR